MAKKVKFPRRDSYMYGKDLIYGGSLLLMVLNAAYLFSLKGLVLQNGWPYFAALVGQIIIWAGYVRIIVAWVRQPNSGLIVAGWFGGASLSFTILQILLYAVLYSITGLNAPIAAGGTEPEKLDATAYIYFSAITWTTVGYGEITPPPGARLLTASEAICGYIFMGVFIAVLGSLLWSGLQKQLEKEKNARREKWEEEVRRARRKAEEEWDPNTSPAHFEFIVPPPPEEE